MSKPNSYSIHDYRCYAPEIRVLYRGTFQKCPAIKQICLTVGNQITVSLVSLFLSIMHNLLSFLESIVFFTTLKLTTAAIVSTTKHFLVGIVCVKLSKSFLFMRKLLKSEVEESHESVIRIRDSQK